SWNKCTFCELYKGEKFSLRPKEHVMEDIRAVRRCVEAIRKNELPGGDDWAYYSARNWVQNGMQSVFLQDANSMIVKPDVLVEILDFLRAQFPEIRRITSYARSHTISRIRDEDLKHIAEAGLNRIHIGMETGCDAVLKLVNKGTDKAAQILAGQRVKAAGIELSEYVMPGLGGME
ncbi:MAG: radical SAM protein, partial [Alphaproteobacteria bacterium]|nr:radical SAM protein [Alphaproteobacteria bacterium]